MNERGKRSEGLALLAYGVFLIWLGLTAIDHGDDWLSGVYVFVASIALAGLMYWIWEEKSN